MPKVLNRAGYSVKKPTNKALNMPENKVKLKNLTKAQRVLYVLALLSGFGLLCTIIAAITIIFTFTAFSGTLPSPSKLTNRSIEQSTKIFDRTGQLLYSVYSNKDRTLVKFTEVSPHLINATLAAEDGDFYEHQGIDPYGIARSAYVIVTGQGKQGGSTLTQQVAKNALLTSDRTVTRKIKDVVLALQIENSYTKDEIIQMYLNEVPYGGATWGAEAAAKTFLGKSTSNLSLAEAALIAGLPQRPTYYSPFGNPEAAKNRQLYVLKLMRDNGWIDNTGKRQYISPEEYTFAADEPLEYASNTGLINAPHFVMYVLDQLTQRYGETAVQQGGLQVTTSLDLKLHNEFQKYVKEEVEKAKALDLTNAALVAIDPKTREILAMIGSVDYYAKDIDGQFNVALSDHRQPGSTLKPITYLTGLNQGYTASSVLYDVPTSFKADENSKSYEPKNYGGWGFRGPIQLRYALANSVNLTAVKMLDLVGIENMVKTANSLGLNFKYDPKVHGLAITLGGGSIKLLDLTNAYSSLAAGGKYKDLSPIMEVKDYKGNTIEKEINTTGRQVVDERNVWIITDILSDNAARTSAFGSNSQLYIKGNKVAVKTGTTNDFKDNWTVGFTKDIAIGVWVGNNNGDPMNSRLASGLTGAAPIWNRAISYYLKDHPNPEFVKPDGIVSANVGVVSGLQPYEDEGQRVEYFIKGTEPTTKSDIFRRVKICDDGNLEDRTYTVYTAEKPEWQNALESWVRGKYKDDEDEMYRHLDPKYDEERASDKFDLDNCED